MSQVESITRPLGPKDYLSSNKLERLFVLNQHPKFLRRFEPYNEDQQFVLYQIPPFGYTWEDAVYSRQSHEYEFVYAKGEKLTSRLLVFDNYDHLRIELRIKKIAEELPTSELPKERFAMPHRIHRAQGQ